MVRYDVNRCSSSLKIVSPDAERFEDSQQFLVVGVVVSFRSRQGPRVKSNRVDPIVGFLRQDSGNRIVRGVSLEDDTLGAKGNIPSGYIVS